MFVELVLFIDEFRNLKLFADVVETDRWHRVVVVVVVVAIGRRRRVTSVAVAIGNEDAVSVRSRRCHVGRYRASQLVDDVRMRVMQRRLT